MAEAELLPSALGLLHLGDIVQEAWTLSLYATTWFRHAWPVKVALGYISYAITDVTPYVAEIVLGATCYVARAVHYAADVLDMLVSTMPAAVATQHHVLTTMEEFIMGLTIQASDVVVGAFQTAEPLFSTLFEQTFLALTAAVQLVPNPFEVVSMMVRFVAWAFRPLYVLSSVFVVPSVRKWINFLVYLTPTPDDVTVLLLRLPLWLDTALLYAISVSEFVPGRPSLASIWDSIPLSEFSGPTIPPNGPTAVPLPDFVQDVPHVTPSPVEMMPDPTEGAIIVRDPLSSFFLHI